MAEDYSRYISILIASLEKKIELLEELLELNERQAALLKGNVSEEEFDSIIERKQERIDLIGKVDMGFDSIYQKARREITTYPERYKEEITSMQELIGRLTDLSVKMETSERRNKMAIDFYISNERQKNNSTRKSVSAVNSYYQNMSGAAAYDSQMFDSTN